MGKSNNATPASSVKSERKWTQAQKTAMSVRKGPILVSAAAGSGKTATLTERIIRMLRGDGTDQPFDISRMLIVTFTRAAASELKAKISKALSEALAKASGDDGLYRHLYRQLLLLSSAEISTIDSFYETPVKANFEKLGLPANLRHADEIELVPLYEQVMNSVIDDMYDKHASSASDPTTDDSFILLINSLVNPRDSSGLIPDLIKLYGKLVTSPEGVGRLKNCAERMKIFPTDNFYDSEIGNAIIAKVTDRLTEYAGILDEAITAISPLPAATPEIITKFTDCLSVILNMTGMLKSRNITGFKSNFPFFKKAPPIPADDAVIQKYRSARNNIYSEMRELEAKYFSLDGDELNKQLAYTADTCFMLYEILSEYDRRIGEEKRSRGICDFSDMPRYMLSLLQNPDGSPTELALDYRTRYDAVCIDEYQDVNELQDRIFELIGCDKRFMVGDIKQSIYGFREADPSLFAGYRKKLPLITDVAEETDSGSTIFMSENFRCDPNVIEFVNMVCGFTFSACPDSIGYTENDDLKLGKTLPDNYVSPKVLLNLIKKPEKGDDPGLPAKEAEAEIAADTISGLIGTKLADGRPASYSDICILMRSTKNVKTLISALTRRKIPVHFSAGGSILDDPETKLLIALINVINNPRSDIDLSEMLQSEFFPFALSLEDVIILRKSSDENDSIYDALCNYSELPGSDELTVKCLKIKEFIEKYRELSFSLSADRLLRELSFDPEFSELTSGDPFTYIYDRACELNKRSWNGIYGFSDYFRRLSVKGDKENVEVGKSAECVTIMSIHHSKGLEFPMCYLYECGKSFNSADKGESILFSKKYGAAVRMTHPETNAEINTVIRALISDEIDGNLKEEEMRILYVGLTRARERLIISGSFSKKFENVLADAQSAKKGDRFSILGTNNYLSWIFNAINGQNDDTFETKYFRSYRQQEISVPENTVSSEADPGLSPSDAEYARIANDAAKITANSALLASLPAKAAASLLKPDMLDKCVISAGIGKEAGQGDIKNPDFLTSDTRESINARIELMTSSGRNAFEYLLEENRKPTAVDRGNAAHLFLQFCDYQNVRDNGIENEIARLEGLGFINSRYASMINVRQAEQFFKSDFFKLIDSAAEVKRELKFNLFIPLIQFASDDSPLRELIGDRTVYVQGSIDLLIKTQSGDFIVCDYKTDRISDEERLSPDLLRRNMVEKHGHQLMQYADAVKAMFGKSPAALYIYSLPLGEAIRIY